MVIKPIIMANLKKFVWEGARDGMKFDIWNASPRLPIPGSAQLILLTPLHAKLEGGALGASGTIEIIMPDEAPRGACSVKLNTNLYGKVPYFTEQDELVLRVPLPDDKTLTIRLSTSWKYSWVSIDHPISVKVGLWPSGQKMEME